MRWLRIWYSFLYWNSNIVIKSQRKIWQWSKNIGENSKFSLLSRKVEWANRLFSYMFLIWKDAVFQGLSSGAISFVGAPHFCVRNMKNSHAVFAKNDLVDPLFLLFYIFKRFPNIGIDRKNHALSFCIRKCYVNSLFNQWILRCTENT